VTACYAILNPATGELRYASAAHPPMLVISPTGEARWLEEGRSPPLGAVDDAARPDASIVLEPGSLLVLYSDGLVERRRESISEGLARLERVAKAHLRAPVEELCDRLVTELGAERARDDAVVMCVRFRPDAPLGGSRRRRRRGVRTP
jgi:serine phosphatase RsbU (regulator of sigma subunit)